MARIVSKSGNADIDGLLWGYKWDTVNLTYSFPTTTSGAYAEYFAGIVGLESLNPAQQAAVRKIIDNYNSVCGLNITPGGPDADLRFAEASTVDYGGIDTRGPHIPGGGTAESNPPDPFLFNEYQIGDSWFSHGKYETPTVGSFQYSAGFMHELGHALGLKHGHMAQDAHGENFPTLPDEHNSYEYSVMTYHQYVGDFTAGDNAPDHPQTLMQDDIAALQWLYGADYGTNFGPTNYTWNRNGDLLINGVAQGLTTAHRNIFLTVWDGGGEDTYDFSTFSINLKIDLNPGAWSTVAVRPDLGDGHRAIGNIANALADPNNPLETASFIDNANGGRRDDEITGNTINNKLNGGGGIDTINGGDGADTLNGGAGNDKVFGGTGDDTIVITGREAVLDQFSGEGGFDKISVIGTTSVTLAAFDASAVSIEEWNGNAAGVVGDAANNVFDFSGLELISGSGIGFIDGSRGNDNIIGSDFADDLRGGVGNDVLSGGDGNDLLNGGAGNDTLIGGADGDTLVGGGGIDTLSYITSDDGVTVQLRGSLNAITSGGDANGDVASQFQNVTGSNYGDVLTGDVNANLLSGLDGDDMLDGGAGNDTMLGGNGDDTFIVDAIGDVVSENLNQGNDSVFSSVTYSLTDNVENLFLEGTAAINGTGNKLANYIEGNDASNMRAAMEATFLSAVRATMSWMAAPATTSSMEAMANMTSRPTPPPNPQLQSISPICRPTRAMRSEILTIPLNSSPGAILLTQS
ncbi:MAG TPA: M10 family metallopeptidase [Bryobacteraceae bacterium]|nr:M10 family metallopeptidase [Bryobacteraceae bacterium]